MFYLAHQDNITYEIIEHKKIPASFSNFTLFFIADVHRRKIKVRTLEKIDNSIDLILIGGDFVERGVPLERMHQNICVLKKLGAPIFFVWGNNDLEANPSKMIKIFQQENVKVLEDQVISIFQANKKINLIGFRYYKESYCGPNINWDELDDCFTILLTHKPSSFYGLQTEVKKKIDLTLTGHTHGGQIRLFGFGLYSKGGLYSENSSTILITEGYGYTLLPLRLQTKAECHVISLQRTFI